MLKSTLDSPSPPPKAVNYVSLAVRCCLVTVVVTGTAAVFAYAGGWFSPDSLTPSRIVDKLEQTGGKYPGYRRNHARGVGVAGYFDSNGNGDRLSKAAIFRPGRVPVIGRFSLSGGNPTAPDKMTDVRGLGLEFSSPDGELWRTAMIDLPVFPVSTPEAFYEMLSTKPADMPEFLKRHPNAAAAAKSIANRSISSGFANTTFHGLNTFLFINSAGEKTPVRWVLVPEQPFESASGDAAQKVPNFLFDNLAKELHLRPLRWRLIVQIGDTDPINDPSIRWSDLRQQVELGVLTLNTVQSEQESPATGINFDPLVLPSGIAPSHDPLLSARSAAYSQSSTRRAGESRAFPSAPRSTAQKGE